MKIGTRKIAAILAAATLTLSAAACATRASSDEIILYYKSGAGENNTFQECIKPGTAGAYPMDDQVFSLPTSLRTWNIRPNGGDSKDPITSGSKPGTDGQPGPSVSIWATADFYLNSDCTAGKNSPIVQFWEQTGRRYKVAADGEDGFSEDNWRTMLMNTLVPAEEKALREQTRNYLADDLDANLGGIWAKMETALGATFASELRAKTGGDYFCGTGYAGGKKVKWTETDPSGAAREVEGTCPPVRISITDVNFTDAGIAEARARVYKAQQDSKAAMIAAQTEVDKAALLSQASRDSAYLELRKIEAQLQAAQACAANPNCTLVIGADGVVAGKK